MSLKLPSDIDEIQAPLDHITTLVSCPEMVSPFNLVFNTNNFSASLLGIHCAGIFCRHTVSV